MALKAIVDDVNALPEAVRGEYKEHQDGDKKYWLLDVEPVNGFELDNVAGLKTALGTERTAKKKLEDQVVKFKDIDPEKARDALARLEEFEKIDPTKEADKIANTKFEAAKTQLLKKHGEDLTAEQTKSGRYRSKINELMIDSVAKSAIAAQKGSIDLLLPHVRSSTRVVEDGDNFKVEVIDAAGSVRIGNSKGEPMTIEELINEMRNSDTFGRAFEGEGTTGSGKQRGTGDNRNGALKRSQMTAKQKGDFIREHGQKEFLKLPLK